MPAILLDKTLRPFFLSFAGVILLMLARSAAYMWRPRYAYVLYNVNMALWLVLAACLIVLAYRAGAQRKFLVNYALALGLFLWGMFPKAVSEYSIFSSQSMIMAGMGLLFVGLLGTRRLHFIFTFYHRFTERLYRIPAWLSVGVMACMFLALSVYVSGEYFDHLPVIGDSVAQYVHAKFMAEGQLYGQSHPLRKFFSIPLTLNYGKWYSQYQPFHIFLISLGHRMGMPFLVNPMEGALTLVVIYLLARRVSDEPTAKLAVLLALCCQFMLIMSSEYMSHSTALLFATLFLLCYIETLEAALRQRILAGCLWGMGGGFCLGAVFLTRPLTSVEFSVPCIAYALYMVRKNPRSHLLPFMMMGAAGMACLIFQGWYNLQTTGKIFLFPYAKYMNVNVPGFNKGHTFWNGLLKAQEEWKRFNARMFEWMIPSTVFLLAACLLPLQNRYQKLLLAVIASATLINTMNRFNSSIFGPRYIYETSAVVIVLSAVGIRRIPLLLRVWHVKLPGRNVVRGLIALMLAVVLAVGWVHYFPLTLKRYSAKFYRGRHDLAATLTEQAKWPALVFIAEGEEMQRPRYFLLSFTLPPKGDAPVIFARDKGMEQNIPLIKYYPSRNAYLEREGRLYPIDKVTFASDAPPVAEEEKIVPQKKMRNKKMRRKNMQRRRLNRPRGGAARRRQP